MHDSKMVPPSFSLTGMSEGMKIDNLRKGNTIKETAKIRESGRFS